MQPNARLAHALTKDKQNCIFHDHRCAGCFFDALPEQNIVLFLAPFIVDSNHVFVVNARLCKRVSNSDSRIQSPTTRHFAPMSGYLWLNIWEGFVGLAFAHMRLLFFGGIFRASGAMT